MGSEVALREGLRQDVAQIRDDINDAYSGWRGRLISVMALLYAGVLIANHLGYSYMVV